MNAERAYRNSVLPLSALMVVCGTIMAVWAWGVRLPITSPFPFVESETLNRHLLGMIASVCAVIGVGLFFRFRIAWYALLVYMGVGILVPVLSAWDARIIDANGYEFPVIGTLLNGVAGVGIYFALRPAFRHDNGDGDPVRS